MIFFFYYFLVSSGGLWKKVQIVKRMEYKLHIYLDFMSSAKLVMCSLRDSFTLRGFCSKGLKRPVHEQTCIMQ